MTGAYHTGVTAVTPSPPLLERVERAEAARRVETLELARQMRPERYRFTGTRGPGGLELAEDLVPGR